MRVVKLVLTFKSVRPLTPVRKLTEAECRVTDRVLTTRTTCLSYVIDDYPLCVWREDRSEMFSHLPIVD